jgi:hypothetical protein
LIKKKTSKKNALQKAMHKNELGFWKDEGEKKTLFSAAAALGGLTSFYSWIYTTNMSKKTSEILQGRAGELSNYKVDHEKIIYCSS